jgi:hypothetical protein
MTDVSGIQAEVLNFREEARGCLQLAQAETLHEVRTVLMGMAIGWLKLADGSPRSHFNLSPPMIVEEERSVEKLFRESQDCQHWSPEWVTIIQ